MNKLQGWDWINSLIGRCPVCGQRGVLGQPALSKKNVWRVCCMNNMCTNFNVTQNYKNFYLAIHEWNTKYAKRSDEDE